MRPLIVMSPKSLLRNKTVAQPIDKFTEGQFQPPTETYNPKSEKLYWLLENVCRFERIFG